jgi:hypothetical protein
MWSKASCTGKAFVVTTTHPGTSVGTDCTWWHLQYQKSEGKAMAPLRMEQFPSLVHWDLLCVHDPRHALHSPASAHHSSALS